MPTEASSAAYTPCTKPGTQGDEKQGYLSPQHRAVNAHAAMIDAINCASEK